MKRRLAPLAVVVGLVLWTAPGAPVGAAVSATGPSWSVVSSPNPPGAVESELRAISCTSSTNCFAVGFYFTSSGPETAFIERWNGSTWTLLPIPLPTGSTGFLNDYSYLDGVSCSGPKSCFAVGTYGSSTSAGGAFIEYWNGTSWSIMPGPDAAHGAGSLLAVSCTSPSRCFAVGEGRDMTLTERWNGSAWSIVPSPNPSGALSSELAGVSCTSAADCIAVGFYYPAGSSQSMTLIERWNGTVWTLVPSPNPPGATETFLYGASCNPLRAAASCFAVGFYGTSTGGGSVAERSHGTAWSITPTPSINAALEAVSCTSDSACFTVGFYPVSSVNATLTERWNGTAWSVVSSPNPSGATESKLFGVSCIRDTGSCFAAGYYSSPSTGVVTLIERYQP